MNRRHRRFPKRRIGSKKPEGGAHRDERVLESYTSLEGAVIFLLNFEGPALYGRLKKEDC
jgi:hypothetical protein